MSDKNNKQIQKWEEKLADIPVLDEWDNHLIFMEPQILDQMQNKSNTAYSSTEYFCRKEYAVTNALSKLNMHK